MAAVYWIGQDGNVWIRQGDATSNLGKPTQVSDDSFQAQYGSGVAERIDDPLPGGNQSPTPAPTSPASTSSSTASAPAPVLNQAAVDATNKAIGSLGTEWDTGIANIRDDYNRLAGEGGKYDQEATRAEGDYTGQTVNNNQNLQRNRQNALLAAAQGRRGLRGTLAAMGALSGSGSDLADRAVTTEANTDLGGAADTAATNAMILDGAIERFREEDEQRRGDAKTAKTNQKTSLQGTIASKRQKLYEKMAKLFEEGGNNDKASEYLGKAGDLNDVIASSSRVQAAPIVAQKAAFTPGDLENYLAGAGDMTVRVAGGGNGGRLNPTSLLAGGQRGRRREEEEEEEAVAV